MCNLRKRTMSEVNHATLIDQAFGWSAIGDCYCYASWFEVGRTDRYPHTRTQRVEPRRRSHFLRIELMAVSHQFSAMLFAVPGCKPLLWLGRPLCLR